MIVSGARREEQRWDASENGQIVMECKFIKVLKKQKKYYPFLF